MRKLLSTAEAARALNRSAKWFAEHREELYAAGFPRPVLGDGPHGKAAYDPHAIDAWLNSRMDPALRQDAAARGQLATQALRSYDAILQKRLEAVA